MENRAEEVVEATVQVNACDSPSPDKKITRRRFVQSTLFPQKSPEKKNVRDCGGVEDEEDEECCGSQGRRKRKHTPGRKQASQPRRAKKVVENDIVAFQEVLDQKNSPGKASPQTQKEKRQASARNRRTNVIQDACTGRLQDHSTLSDHISQLVPDLRLEAKKTAEEDSRRFAGRKLHPFFSSCKVGRKNQETANPEVQQSLTEKEDKYVECGPIHVYENLTDNNITSVDWSNWAFHDAVYNNPNCHEQIISSSDGSVESLRLDKILHISNSLQEPFLAHESLSHEEVAKKAILPSPAHDEAEPCQLSQGIYMESEDNPLGELIFRSENSSCLVSNVEKDNSTSQEWLPYSFRRTNQPQNCLWTYKYQPEKAAEVCGNEEHVKLINDWLCLWRERDLRNCSQRFKTAKCSLEEDCNSYDIDSDVESIDEETGLKNVLLVSGPVGSGKSATIYACAKEQGFEVIEVNSSDWRSGALIKQRFGEAVGLHWLKGSLEVPTDIQSMLERKSLSSKPTSVSTAEVFNEDAVKLITIPDDETTNDAVIMSQRSFCSDTNIRDSGEVKTLILFEEVDATLFEDRGFIATIQQLAQTAKRPMILTSNSCYPILPESLDREEVHFSIPSQKELLHHACTVCNAEKSYADPHMIEKYIKYCQGDIRKTLMHLQFWCQGQNPKSDPNGLKIYSSLMFDLDAGHEILSKMIPWGFPSQLSAHIEMEIAKVSRGMEEHLALFEGVENAYKLNKHDSDEGLMTSIEAKKRAILSGNFDSYHNDPMSPVVHASELSHSSGSPVAFSRRNSSKKLAFVLFDSEDEISNYEPPGKSDHLCRDSINDLTASTIDPESQNKCPAVEGLLNPVTGLSVCSAGKKMAESWQQCSLTLDENNGLCHSGSVSCVPESTFVPETEVGDERDNSEREDQKEVISRTIFENEGQPILKFDELSETTEYRCNRDVNVVDAEVADSQNEYEDFANFTRGYQVLDECSRMDFCRGSKRLKKCNSKLKLNFVQETWKDLQCTDFRPHITKEDKDASEAMRLASKMCNLIAEADILLHNCKILTHESFEPGVNVVEDFFTFGWHDQQLRMASAIAEHGYCVFAKDVAVLGSRIGLDSRVDVAWEMLTSTQNTMALGKLLRHGRTDQTLFPSGQSKSGLAISRNSITRETVASLHEIVHSVVPPKCLLALRGSTMEYLSTLSHMSKSESHRTSESPDNKRRRRKRIAKNYLSCGSLSLSPEDISVLVAYNCSKNCPSESTQREES